MKSIVHFGAGNIGRGFIGALFSNSNYHLNFADVDPQLITKLNNNNTYSVKTAETMPTETVINNFSGINITSQTEQLYSVICEATFITTAVGPDILKKIAPTIANALQYKHKTNRTVLHIIACENQINASSYLEKEVSHNFSTAQWSEIKTYVFFHNCAVDRIIPNQNNNDTLDLIVDPYYEWIVENTSNTTIPQVAGMQLVTNISPYIERKLFTVNTGHASIAYLGFLQNKKTIADSLEDEQIYKQVKAVLQETKIYLINKYQTDSLEQDLYIKKILKRFQNANLRDDVARVGRSPLRKLQPNERFIKPAHELCEQNYLPENLINIIFAVLKFAVPTDPESVELQTILKTQNINYVLENICKLTPNDKLHQQILARATNFKI